VYGEIYHVTPAEHEDAYDRHHHQRDHEVGLVVGDACAVEVDLLLLDTCRLVARSMPELTASSKLVSDLALTSVTRAVLLGCSRSHRDAAHTLAEG